nr:protein plastid movement impaired 1-related 1 [Tanacetum cinerariifolium]
MLSNISVEESVLVPQFKISEVHVAGVKTEPTPCKKPLWGSNTKQQQAGCRWLVANGMGKTNAKQSLMKSNADTSNKMLSYKMKQSSGTLKPSNYVYLTYFLLTYSQQSII